MPAPGVCLSVRGALVLVYLEGLDEGPQEGPDTFPPAQQLHQPHHPEQSEESDGDAGVVIGVLRAEHSTWRAAGTGASRQARGGPGPGGGGKGNEIPLSNTSHSHRITESQNVRGWKGPLWVI